ncbi:hypothetical protein GCM10009624_32790 [Gordonia sinesedis]
MTPSGTRTLVLGGVRSGKSEYGEVLLEGAAEIRYLATGPSTSSDAEWVARVERHRRRRDDRHTTVETTDLAAELRAAPATPTLVDDLGNWVASRLDATDAWSGTTDLSAETAALCDAIADFDADLVLISPEAGLSLVPPTPAGRVFQDELGAVNRAVAAVCDRVVLVVAGRVVELPAAESDSRVDVAGSAGFDTSAPSSPTTQPAETVRTQPAETVRTQPAEHPTARSAQPAEHPTVRTQPEAERAGEIAGRDAEVFATIDPPDEAVADAARARQLSLTKPAGALGRLEDIGVWIAACQGVCPPRAITQPAVVVFAGDHGVAQGGVSAYPPEVTAQMVANIASGGAAVNVLAARSGAQVRVVDMSVDAETAPELSTYKVRRGSDDLRVTDAMSLADARAALAAGRAIADDLVDSGADLLIAGDMGIGNTTPAAVIIGTLARREPVEVIGRGTGIDDLGWMCKTAAIRDGMHRSRTYRHDPLALLAAAGGADLAAMTGFVAQAALRRTPVIVDGVVVTAAALVAAELAPGAVRWWLAGHRSSEPAHSIALEHLDLEPVLDLSMRLGEGTGAVLALPTVLSAVDILTSMATFDEAGVTDRDATESAVAESAGR